jgi:hypothetical protein
LRFQAKKLIFRAAVTENHRRHQGRRSPSTADLWAEQCSST